MTGPHSRSDDELASELDAFFRSYGAAFGAGDVEAIDGMCEYPFIVSDADGTYEVADSQFYRSLIDRFRKSEFAETRYSAIEKLKMGADGAVIVTRFRRFGSDGAPLDDDCLPFPNGCAYFLRRREDGWKIIGLADPINDVARREQLPS